MGEQDNRNETFIAVFSEKIDQLILTVNEIKTSLQNNDMRMRNIEERMIRQEEKDASQQKEIDSIKSGLNGQKKWIMGLASGTILAIITAVIKMITNM